MAHTIAITVFVGSLCMIAYAYFGYPVFLAIITALRNKTVKKGEYQPFVTILIAAYNEEKCIAETIANKLALHYPKDNYEIIVVSDGSTDKTDAIVQQFANHKVTLLRQEPRAGKTMAVNLGITRARGEIVVFSDANSLWDAEALGFLMQNFNDPRVGYVTGKMIYTNPDGAVIGDGCSAYMKYENFLRTLETRAGSVVGVDGGIDAVRKSLYRPMNADQLPDFVQPLSVCEQGYRVVYEERAILKETTLQNTSDEYRMRVRVALRAYWALYDKANLLFNPRNLLFSWQLWSHKVIRYGCFLFLIGAYISNAVLAGTHPVFLALFILQNMGYGAALLAKLLEQRGLGSSLLNLCHFFVVVNFASGHAFLNFIQGQKKVLWTPRKG